MSKECFFMAQSSYHQPSAVFSFFFNDTATTEIYTLSLHDALPISRAQRSCCVRRSIATTCPTRPARAWRDRKSTRLNSSHANISYAVFCLKKKATDWCDAKIDIQIEIHVGRERSCDDGMSALWYLY